jgi:hypothetical protein
MFFIVLSPAGQHQMTTSGTTQLTDDTSVVDQDMYRSERLDSGVDDLLTFGY